MDNRYIWEEKDIKFVDGEANQSVSYSDFAAEGCPFVECACNSFCNGKCNPGREEKAYDLACKIYDGIADEISAEDDTKRQLELLKKQMNQNIDSTLDEGIIMCIKVQLVNELKAQTAKKIDKDLCLGFIRN
ncbi:MAG: hypothetical protein J6V80_01645 [Clostridia bacterium]|nr:hypothetical protein [Clostridia bacterium]